MSITGVPSLSMVAVVWRETGGARWAFFQLGYLTALAYIASLLVYQIGRLFGF